MRQFLTALLLLLISLKIALVLSQGPTEIQLDAKGYWRMSDHVVSGDVLVMDDHLLEGDAAETSVPNAYRTPIYPWFLALIRLVSPRPLLTIVAIQGWMTLASLLFAGWIAARISKQASAVNWTLLAALPMLSSYVFAAAILTESMFTFFLMLHLLSVLDYAKYDSKRRLVWMSVTFGLTLLTRPIVMLVWLPHVVFVLWIHWRRRNRIGKSNQARVKLHHRFGHALLGAGVVLLLASPWLFRNYQVFGKPFLTEFVGRNLWIVTFRDGSGAGLELPNTTESQELQRRLGDVGAAEHWQDTWKVSRALTKSGLDDAEGDRLMKSVAAAAVVQNQEAFGWKAFRRCINYWRCTATDLPQQGADGNYQDEQTWAYNVPYIEKILSHRFSLSLIGNTVLMFVMIGACLTLVWKKTSRPYGVWLTLILAYFAVVTGVLEIPDYRYRMVTEPVVALVVGAAIATVRGQRNSESVPETQEAVA